MVFSPARLEETAARRFTGWNFWKLQFTFGSSSFPRSPLSVLGFWRWMALIGKRRAEFRTSTKTPRTPAQSNKKACQIDRCSRLSSLSLADRSQTSKDAPQVQRRRSRVRICTGSLLDRGQALRSRWPRRFYTQISWFAEVLQSLYSGDGLWWISPKNGKRFPMKKRADFSDQLFPFF